MRETARCPLTTTILYRVLHVHFAHVTRSPISPGEWPNGVFLRTREPKKKILRKKNVKQIIWRGESCKEAMEVFQPAGHSALLGTSAADFSKGKANRTKYSDNIPDVPTQLLQFRGCHLPDSSTQDVKLNDFCKKKHMRTSTSSAIFALLCVISMETDEWKRWEHGTSIGGYLFSMDLVFLDFFCIEWVTVPQLTWRPTTYGLWSPSSLEAINCFIQQGEKKSNSTEFKMLL